MRITILRGKDTPYPLENIQVLMPVGRKEVICRSCTIWALSSHDYDPGKTYTITDWYA